MLKYIIIFTIICQLQSKYISFTIQNNYFRHNKWKYITKFGMDIGKGQF